MRIQTILTSALLAPALLAQRAPEVEPNDTVAQAQVVVQGTQIDGGLIAGESDWYSFTTAGGQVRITTNGLDTKITLWDSTGLVGQGISDDVRALFSSDITINLAPGTYTVQVQGYTATTAGPYSIEVATDAALKPYTGLEVEPNDTVAQAQLVTNGAQISGSLSSATDVDIYMVMLTAPRTGVWFQVTEGDAPWLSQHRYEIYDAAGALLVPTTTFGANAGDSSTLNCRASQIRVWPAGMYHFAVRNRSVAPTTNNPVPLGNYRFEFAEMPMNTGAVVAEIEPNNGFATATPINPGDQGTGNLTISTGADASDWWGPITLLTPSVLQFQTGLGAAPAIADTTINIRAYDPVTNTVGAPTAVTTGNILDPTSHARGTFIFTLTPNQYYLEVVSPGAAATQAGNYVLEIGAILSAPYVAASYATAAVNGACGVAPFPTFTRQFTNEVPLIGTSFVRTVTGLPAGGAVLLLQGLTTASANGGAVPLPFDLTSLGAPSCTLNVDPAAIGFFVADASGNLELIQNTPAVVGFRGLPIYEQAAALNPAANALGIQMSNWGRMIIGERSY